MRNQTCRSLSVVLLLLGQLLCATPLLAQWTNGCWVDERTLYLPNPEDRPWLPFFVQGNKVNELTVRLDLDNADLVETITGQRASALHRSQAERLVVASINDGLSRTLRYFHEPLEAWHLESDRMTAQQRDQLQTTDVQEIRQQSIVLRYPYVETAEIARERLLTISGVLDVTQTLYQGHRTPPPPYNLPPARAYANGLFEMINRTMVSAENPIYLRNVGDQNAVPPYQPFLIEFLAADAAFDLPYQSLGMTVENRVITIEYLLPRTGSGTSNRSFYAHSMGLPPGEHQLRIVGRHADGTRVEFYSMSFRVTEPPTTLPVYSLYHPEIDHYFLTTCGSERDEAIQDGWISADAGFNAWPAHGTPYPFRGSSAVCRFYSIGANSHFFTANENECMKLQAPGSGWTFEGVRFRVLPSPNGTCLPETVPVWRLYNNRHAQQDSNHRFVAGIETYRAMIADGWSGEDIAFCAPPAAH